jgi:hypothetical protein
MFPLSWESDDWAFVDQPPKLSAEQKKQREKEDYDKLHALVLSRISAKEDLNQPMPGILAHQTLLHKSCRGGDAYLPITQLLLTHGANPNVIDAHNKSTPLHNAIHDNGLETVKLLLSSGAHPDSRNILFGTPLQGICTRGDDVLHNETIAKKRIRIVKLLLFHGANPNAKNEFQTSCFHGVIATTWRDLNSIDSLKNSNKALFFIQRKALIRALVLYGANLNAIDSQAKTAIQKAYQAVDNPKNQPYLTELADYALNYSNYLRTRLLYILGHSGTHKEHETPFKALPQDIVKCIIDFAHPAYNEPQIIKAQKT